MARTLACEHMEIALAVNHDVDKLLVKLLNLLRCCSPPPQLKQNLTTILKHADMEAAEDSVFLPRFKKKSKKWFLFDALAKRLHIK